MQIRDARSGDLEALAALAGQLGYPVEAAALAGRFQAIAARDGDAVLVAVDDRERVVGFAHAVPQRYLIADPFVDVAALVVDEHARGRGVGKALLAAVESWARGRGFPGIRVRSNVVREHAHRFYLRAGYTEVKRQAVFARQLARGPAIVSTAPAKPG